MATVKIASRLPFGLEIHLDDERTKKVTLNGINSSKIIGAEFGLTDVDASFWGEWMKMHGSGKNQHPAIKNQVIFEVKDESAAESKVSEIKKDLPTKLEPIDPESMGVEAA